MHSLKKATMNPKESYLTLLKQQLLQIDERNFDLSSWKKATALLLTSCFGPHSAQVAAIEKIDYAYSSWALRDESGTNDPVKTDCKSTLATIIKEYEIKAHSDEDHHSNKQELSDDLNFMWLPFEDELTGSALKRLKALLTKANPVPEELEMFLKDLPNQTLVNILQNTLLADKFKHWISQ